MEQKGILYWITGLSGAGKTTIGTRLYYELRKKQDNVVLLDGDALKKIVDNKGGYSEEERKERAIQYAMICKMLTDQGMIVICCTIAMYNEVREWNRKNNKGYVEIFLDVPMEILVRRDQKSIYSQYRNGKINNIVGVDIEVEFPQFPDIRIVNDGQMTVKECVDEILKYKVTFSNDFDRDTKYWNNFYCDARNISEPSLFATTIGKQLLPEKNLLELGCGNGRDSLYFYHLGLNVTAIDASDIIIKKLQNDYPYGNICFICDDFVCSPTIFAGQYDYCYSRFTIHSINEEQESEVIKNVYKVLKDGGKFFIEVRSVNDKICGKGKKIGRNSYIYEGHYRRFIVKEELEQKMINVGFDVEYSEEKEGFAPFKNTNPPIIRLIGKKKIIL